jgi:hypothetical protein
MIKNLLRHFILTHERQRASGAATIKNCHNVSIAIKTASLFRHVIGDNHVEILFAQLFLGIHIQIAGLRSKTDQ